MNLQQKKKLFKIPGTKVISKVSPELDNIVMKIAYKLTLTKRNNARSNINPLMAWLLSERYFMDEWNSYVQNTHHEDRRYLMDLL